MNDRNFSVFTAVTQIVGSTAFADNPPLGRLLHFSTNRIEQIARIVIGRSFVKPLQTRSWVFCKDWLSHQLRFKFSLKL